MAGPGECTKGGDRLGRKWLGEGHQLRAWGGLADEGCFPRNLSNEDEMATGRTGARAFQEDEEQVPRPWRQRCFAVIMQRKEARGRDVRRKKACGGEDG